MSTVRLQNVVLKRDCLKCYLLKAQVDFIVVLCVKMYASVEFLVRRKSLVHVTGIHPMVHGRWCSLHL